MTQSNSQYGSASSHRPAIIARATLGISRRDAWIAAIWLLAIICFERLSVRVSNAQKSVKAELIGFVFPIPDEQGGKTVIRGERGRVLEDDTIDLIGVVVETYRGLEKEMIVEADQCFFDRVERVAWSEGALTVRAASGQYSVKGRGFQWTGSDSVLVISNSVETVLRKRDFDPELLAAARSKPAANSRTEDASSSGDQIEVRSNRLEMRGTRALFKGGVQARDSSKTLSCGMLAVKLGVSGKGADEIVAEADVVFADGDLQTKSRKAVYSVLEETVLLTGDASWQILDKEGSADSVTIHKGSELIHAKGNVRVRLAPSEFVPVNWFPKDSGKTSDSQHSEPVEIQSDSLDYSPDATLFEGNVRAQTGGGRFRSDRLRIVFTKDEGKLAELHAEGNVRFEQGDSVAFGERFDYGQRERVMTLSGSPGWKAAGGSGTSDRLIFDPASNRMQGDGNVVTRFSRQSGRWPDFSSLSRADAKTAPLTKGDFEIEIRAGKLFYRSDSAIFLEKVQMTLSSGSGRELRSEVLAAFFEGPENMLDELIAEERVVIRQPGIEAFGEKVIHKVSTGIAELSGNPRIRMDGKRYYADSFRIESSANLFRMKGNYRIEIDPGKIEKLEERRTPKGF